HYGCKRRRSERAFSGGRTLRSWWSRQPYVIENRHEGPRNAVPRGLRGTRSDRPCPPLRRRSGCEVDIPPEPRRADELSADSVAGTAYVDGLPTPLVPHINS